VQASEDYKAEIERIGKERDVMLVALDNLKGLYPKVSVIIVNYNGREYIESLVDSLNNQSIHPDEIIIVDNSSTDGSIDAFKKINSKIALRIIESKKNLGFSGGNNLGVSYVESPLVAFLNNDTLADKFWLENMLYIWSIKKISGEKIGVIAPKIRFLHPFLSFEFRIKNGACVPGNGDDRDLGIAIDVVRTRISDTEYIKPIFISGFYQEEAFPGGRMVRWTNSCAQIRLPIDVDEKERSNLRTLSITAKSVSQIGSTEVEIVCGQYECGSIFIHGDFAEYEIKLPEPMIKNAEWVINNAGSEMDDDGNSVDIGIYEFDLGQYNNGRKINAFCGCSFLMDREIFLKMHGFDEDFFMYYEDTDLSWRLNKEGYSIYYEPKAIVRHIHAGTSKEGSRLFNYFVRRNSVIIKIKNLKLRKSILLSAAIGLRFFKKLILNREYGSELSIIYMLPKIFYRRVFKGFYIK
jgi:GT2 family glycosyltransferase